MDASVQIVPGLQRLKKNDVSSNSVKRNNKSTAKNLSQRISASTSITALRHTVYTYDWECVVYWTADISDVSHSRQLPDVAGSLVQGTCKLAPARWVSTLYWRNLGFSCNLTYVVLYGGHEEPVTNKKI